MKNKFIYNITAMDMKPQSFWKFINLNDPDKHYANMSVQYTAIFYGCENDNFKIVFLLLRKT